jgi:hypothetical protein
VTEPPRSGEPRVKGIAFRTIDLCFGELRGEQARERAFELMPQSLADGFRYRTLLAASWYPIGWYRETFQALRAATGEGPELPRAIGKQAVRHDMSGVHKQIFVKIVSPQVLLGMSQRVFNTYYDTGRFEIVESRRGFVRARCSGCFGWDQNMWSEITGSCESLLEIAGAEHVRLRAVSGALDGDSHAEFEAHWA